MISKTFRPFGFMLTALVIMGGMLAWAQGASASGVGTSSLWEDAVTNNSAVLHFSYVTDTKYHMAISLAYGPVDQGPLDPQYTVPLTAYDPAWQADFMASQPSGQKSYGIGELTPDTLYQYQFCWYLYDTDINTPVTSMFCDTNTTDTFYTGTLPDNTIDDTDGDKDKGGTGGRSGAARLARNRSRGQVRGAASNPGDMSCPLFTQYMRRGDRDGVMGITEVNKLQRFLNDRGFSAGTVDGVFGDMTEEGLKKWQGAHTDTVLSVWSPVLKPTGYFYKASLYVANQQSDCIPAPVTLENGTTLQ
jgi:hypothetical protein